MGNYLFDANPPFWSWNPTGRDMKHDQEINKPKWDKRMGHREEAKEGVSQF